jgi:anti-sigma B factor antagonist
MGDPTEPRFLVAAEPAGDGVVVLSAAGELHMSTAPTFGAHAREVLKDGPRCVVVDLSAVQFIDSTGLGVLLNLLREVERQGGEMVVVSANPTVLRLFAITGTDATLDVRPTRAAALQAVGAA